MTFATFLLAAVVLITGMLVWVGMVVFVCSMFALRHSPVLELADDPPFPHAVVGGLEDEADDDDEEDERPLAPVIPIARVET